MKPFLQELAEQMISRHETMDDFTFVFPNRRAALYFQNYLSLGLTRPKWAPALYSIEEYFKKLSSLEEPDRLTLIYRLYKVYGETVKSSETFDRFYFWGEMLLRDFDEIDKYMVDAGQLFKDLSKLKELDTTFDYLTEEQKKFLLEFWAHFDQKPSVTREEFLRLWRKLPKVYEHFTRALRKEGLAYEGMIHRDVAERLLKKPAGDKKEKLVFAGFNALTRAEQVLISAMVANGASVYWDLDNYYTDNKIQEAGQFLREYENDPVLGKTFAQQKRSFIQTDKKNMAITGVPQRIGQAKLAGERVAEILAGLPKDNLPMELSKTVVVLPDESMLLPVMHSLPAELQDINVTMGFPLRQTPMFNLVDQVIEMQVRRRGKSFSHREVTAILGHAYSLGIAGTVAQDALQQIIKRNKVYVNPADLAALHPLFELMFRPVEPQDSTAWLLSLLEYLGASFTDKKSFDREYAFHFYQQVSRLHSIFMESGAAPDWRGFQKLFRQVILSHRIPFRGEPLRGLQIMGVLETRNLDFDNVIFLSANEGMLPASARQGSYVPHAIRKAYRLPTFEHNDSIYAYLFYRLLQRATNIQFYFNTEPDVVGNGELSRYLQQLLMESGLTFEQKVLHNIVHVHKAPPIVIPKTEAVLAQLSKYLVNEAGESAGRLTPSNLNHYIDCGLQFYLRHIARLAEAEEVEEDVDARIFGNIVHDVMRWFYEALLKQHGGQVTREVLKASKGNLDTLIDKAFRKHYYRDTDGEVVYEGQRVVVREVALTFVRQIIERDMAHAPFEILMVEEPFGVQVPISEGRKVRIGGTIDRVDRKNGIVRVIDYKTGGDDIRFESIESLFNRDGKRSKAVFQTIFYAYAYQLMNVMGTEKIVPGLINRKTLFAMNEHFGHKMGKGKTKVLIENIQPMLPLYEEKLHALLSELYDPAVPFTQTTYTQSCTYCSYKSLCRR